MTRSQQFPPRNHPAPYLDLVNDEDEDLSPSDGYFGGNNSIPNTILIPDPFTGQPDPNSSSSKATEAARESDSNSPSETRYASYTPATVHTPATSSRGSESAHNGSTSRYQDSEDGLSERSPLLEPPPLYDDAISQRPPSNNMNGTDSPMPPPRSVRESLHVREPVSSFRTSGFGGRSAPQSLTVGVDGRTGKIYDEESEPAIPRQSRRRGCFRRREPHKGHRGRFKRFLSFLLGTILAIWLLAHLSKEAKRAYGHPQTPTFPVNGTNPPAANREIRQHETSRSISGTYPLYDLLDIKTHSGSISITIVPHPGTAPAVLSVASNSGSIKIKIDKSYLNAAEAAQYQDALKRTFDTKISSTSGSISGSVLIGGGGETTITSRSGTLNLNIHPVNISHSSPESRLSTTTSSGTSNIKVHDPVFGGKLTQLAAHHHSTGSGSLNIKYPSTWEGSMHGKSTGSGSVNVRGQGLQFEQHGNREVVAWRGGDKSRKEIDVTTLGSGSINFTC